MFLKKELKVSMELVVYKDDLDKTKYDESELEKLINDLFYGDFKNTYEGPLLVQSICIHENGNGDGDGDEWQVETD
jgi:hypothetical protein